MESFSKFNLTNNKKDYESFIEHNLDVIIEKYHRAERKYRSLYDNSPDLLRTINFEGIIIDCNETYTKALGYNRDETVGASIFEHVASESLSALKDSFTTWKTNGNVRDRIIWLKRKDGSTFPTLINASNLYDRNGSLVGSNTTIRDISEIFRAQKVVEEQKTQLQEQFDHIRISNDIVLEKERRYRELYENSLDLLRTIDLNGEIIDCNSAYAENLRYTKQEVLGKTVFAHTAERSLKDLHETLNDWEKAVQIKAREIWLKRKDGSEFPTLISLTNLHDKNGNLTGRIASLRDITEIYMAKEEIEQQKLKRISDMGMLSARIAHDLKNPLSVIKNSMELMKMRASNLDTKTRNDCERVERAVSRISHQIEEVLEYVWPKPLVYSTTSLLDIFDTIKSKINLQHVTMELPSTDVNIVCDSAKLEIVFSNLILNAIQAMNGTGNISLRIEDEVKTTRIEVEDTGPGIPDDLLLKIFEPLFTTKQIGTGLGLVSCKNIIEKHGGSIDIETKAGRGTKFIIRLPKNHLD